MAPSVPRETRTYQGLYEQFDSPLMRRVRSEAYGEDVGQHSWVTADDLRRDLPRLTLTGAATLLDLGCGPCGPLTFLMQAVGCAGHGLDLSPAALAAGRRRATTLAVADRLQLREADLDSDLALAPRSFDAAISFDVALHLRDRGTAFQQVSRALVPGGRFLLTDAAVVTGALSSDDVAARSVHGFTQFSAPGYNEALLERCGFTLLETEDRTGSLVLSARGRLEARSRYRPECEQLEGVAGFARYQAYLQTVVSLSERAALSRIVYLAEAARA